MHYDTLRHMFFRQETNYISLKDYSFLEAEKGIKKFSSLTIFLVLLLLIPNLMAVTKLVSRQVLLKSESTQFSETPITQPNAAVISDKQYDVQELGIEVDNFAISQEIVKGETKKVLTLTSSGATGFTLDSYPTEFGEGIDWVVNTGDFDESKSVDLYIRVADNVPEGTYYGFLRMTSIPNNVSRAVVGVTITVKNKEIKVTYINPTPTPTPMPTSSPTPLPATPQPQPVSAISFPVPAPLLPTPNAIAIPTKAPMPIPMPVIKIPTPAPTPAPTIKPTVTPTPVTVPITPIPLPTLLPFPTLPPLIQQIINSRINLPSSGIGHGL